MTRRYTNLGLLYLLYFTQGIPWRRCILYGMRKLESMDYRPVLLKSKFRYASWFGAGSELAPNHPNQFGAC